MSRTTRVTITAAVYTAIVDRAFLPLDDSDVRRNADGSVSIALQERTLERLKRVSPDADTALRSIMNLPKRKAN